MDKNLKLLVVDDNEEFSQNVKDILELKEYKVLTAIDGFSALDIIKEEKIDLVLMDIKMPVMDGVETFKKMKKIIPDVPVIMVTAFAVEELIRDALRDGAFGILRKPLDFDKLFFMIEEALPNGSLILTVDDDDNFCDNIKDILTTEGYRVQVALDSESAIQLVRENKFDIMLLDMKLPPLNGLETYLAIRDIRPQLVVIIITGYLNEMSDLIQKAKQKSVYACLEKPIKMDNLLEMLKQIENHKAEK